MAQFQPCRSTKKQGQRHHLHGDGRPPGGNKAHGVCRSGMIASTKETYRKADAVSRRKHAIRKAPYAHLDFTMRLALQAEDLGAPAGGGRPRGARAQGVRHRRLVQGRQGRASRRRRQVLPQGGDRADRLGQPQGGLARLLADEGARRRRCGAEDRDREVSHQRAHERILVCPVYYTRAYASYEKGAVENVNRIIRRWFPKGTDFSKVPREDVLAVEAIVNSIHRRSLKGETAHECHSHLAKTP